MGYFENIGDFYSDSNYSSSSKIYRLKEYFTFDKKKLMSRSEVKLYEWILKKQYTISMINLYTWENPILQDGTIFRTPVYAGEYLIYRVSFKIMSEEEKFNNQQNKYRARHHGKMGR